MFGQPVPALRERLRLAVNFKHFCTATFSQQAVVDRQLHLAADAYSQAGAQFAPLLAELRKLVTEDLAALEEKLEAAGAPWTPGRLPQWGAE